MQTANMSLYPVDSWHYWTFTFSPYEIKNGKSFYFYFPFFIVSNIFFLLVSRIPVYAIIAHFSAGLFIFGLLILKGIYTQNT
jgi:hypothetical protein